MKTQKGFTLLEILLVVAAISILAGIVIVAINPSKQLGETRNAKRYSDVRSILDAVHQYSIDNNGALPIVISTSSPTEICKTGAACTGLTDLEVITLNGKYLISIPIDPSCPTDCATFGVGYKIYRDSTTNRVTVSAPSAEQNKTINATR